MKKVIMTLALAAGIAAFCGETVRTSLAARHTRSKEGRAQNTLASAARTRQPTDGSSYARDLFNIGYAQYGSLQLREKWLALRARSHEGKPRRA